ncbi:MAG: hypothetical protein ABI696_13915 [Rubrivivax sp.]
MELQQALRTAQALGLTLPSPAYLFGVVLFGLAGLVGWRIGRKQHRPRSVGIGWVLMLFPYLVSQTWLLYTIGAALCAGLWIDHRG